MEIAVGWMIAASVVSPNSSAHRSSVLEFGGETLYVTLPTQQIPDVADAACFSSLWVRRKSFAHKISPILFKVIKEATYVLQDTENSWPAWVSTVASAGRATGLSGVLVTAIKADRLRSIFSRRTTSALRPDCDTTI